ncbi:iron-sulfur cluster assembly scaffold protein [Candidatus Woesearchaeota archaeon]|nr:iron-sulfur cluster assembly scaffold protein [Candidatus Woesearchaeota archaeon]
MYSEKVMQHFKTPKNLGKLEHYDAVGQVGNASCGDVMYVYIKVENDAIVNIGFETMGCAAAIATSSMVTEIAKGKTLTEAKKITRDTISKELGGLPPLKEHCSNLAADALQEAIKNYESKKQ